MCVCIYIYIYIYNLALFSIINSRMCLISFMFSQLFSKLDSTVHCLWEKQHHDAVSSSRNLETTYLAFTTEASIFQSLGVNLRTMKKFRKDVVDSYCDFDDTAIWKPYSDRSYKKKPSNLWVKSWPLKQQSQRVNKIHNPGYGSVWVSHLIEYEDIRYFRYKMKKGHFFISHSPWRTRGKTVQ